MGLEAVVEEIRGKGRTEADRIQAESKQETDKILAAAGRRAGEIKLAAEAESAKQIQHIIDQEVSAANLLVKRELLNTQKALLDKVYEATRTEIARLPESFHREAIKKLLTEVKKEVSQGKIQCS
jgi:V/A-type H+-transporting ATPase subunit E